MLSWMKNRHWDYFSHSWWRKFRHASLILDFCLKKKQTRQPCKKICVYTSTVRRVCKKIWEHVRCSLVQLGWLKASAVGLQSKSLIIQQLRPNMVSPNMSLNMFLLVLIYILKLHQINFQQEIYLILFIR